MSAAAYLSKLGQTFQDKDAWMRFLEGQFIVNAATIMVAHDHLCGNSQFTDADLREAAADGALVGQMLQWDMQLQEQKP
jgi:hypothetical protein